MNFSTIFGLFSYGLFSLTTIFLFFHVHHQVPEVYMDEFFHFYQAKNYCLGNFQHWDKSITTPPGLYLITQSLEFLFNHLSVFDGLLISPCELGLARFTNVMFMLILPWIFIQYFEKACKKDLLSSIPSAICISVHPLIYFFTFLYYTDVGSLLFAMISLTCHVHQHRFYSALFSLISLTFRQTNIIIVAYEIGWSLINEMEEKSKQSEICRVYASQSIEKSNFNDYFLVLWKNGRKEFHLILNILRSCLWKCRYQIIVIFFFVLFFIWNNHSITLGHQEHHQMVFHLAQLNYFAVYSAFFLAAHVLTSKSLNELIWFLRSNPFLVAFFLLLINFAVKYYTYEHLFLISDNRHYTFYLWSRLFKRYESFRYWITPIYFMSIVLIYFQLRHRSLLNVILLLVSIFLLTIFQKLLEFRYFILPFILLRLAINNKTKSALFVEFVQAILINSATIYVFCHRTFVWPSQLDTKQRFMY